MTPAHGWALAADETGTGTDEEVMDLLRIIRALRVDTFRKQLHCRNDRAAAPLENMTGHLPKFEDSQCIGSDRCWILVLLCVTDTSRLISG